MKFNLYVKIKPKENQQLHKRRKKNKGINKSHLINMSFTF